MNIVVAYRRTGDGSDALRLGIRLCRHLKGQMQIVSVIAPDASEARAASAHAELEEAQRESMEKGVPTESHVVRNDSVPDGLLATAHQLQAMMLVLGTATGGLLRRFTLGSVSNVLVHSSDVPIALAPDSIRDADDARPWSRVSVAVGDLGGNRSMFAMARLLAEPGNRPVRLLTVIADDGADSEAKRDQASGRLGTMALAVLPSTMKISTQVEIAGRIDRAVEQVYWDPEEIVLIGSSRIAQASHAFLGPTAAKIVRALSVPMVIVPRDDQAPGLLTAPER